MRVGSAGGGVRGEGGGVEGDNERKEVTLILYNRGT